MELGSDLEGHESDTVSLATEGGEMPALLYLLDLLWGWNGITEMKMAGKKIAYQCFRGHVKIFWFSNLIALRIK